MQFPFFQVLDNYEPIKQKGKLMVSFFLKKIFQTVKVILPLFCFRGFKFLFLVQELSNQALNHAIQPVYS